MPSPIKGQLVPYNTPFFPTFGVMPGALKHAGKLNAVAANHIKSFPHYSNYGVKHGKVHHGKKHKFHKASSPGNGTIKFYNKNGKYYELTNFYENYRHGKLIKVRYKGKNYKTSEHAFQATKFDYNNPQAQKICHLIKKAHTARQAFDIAQKNQHLIRKNWNQKKDHVMYEIVRSKFSKDKHLRNVLMKTGNCKLIEASPFDAYWGWGKNHQGQNKLGQILMQVRGEMKKGLY